MVKRVVIDASVLVDLYAAPSEERAAIAESIASWVVKGLIESYAPKLMMVELSGVLSRHLTPNELKRVLNSLPPIKLFPEETFYDEALRLAQETGSRAADTYYIAVAAITNSPLLTNDRKQAENARKAGIEAYYLINEFEAAKKYLEIT